jgi:hypothetical protein
MDQVGAFLTLVAPVLIVFYMAFLLFIRPPKPVFLASLLGGLITGLVNLLVDIAAYYAHWWHYTLSELVLHVPLPFYVSSVLIFGSLTYLLIWRFWYGNARWFSYLLLAGMPLFCIIRDSMVRHIIGDGNGAFAAVDNATLAPLMVAGMWLVAFFAGFWLFWRLASSYRPVVNNEDEVPRSGHEQTRA